MSALILLVFMAAAVSRCRSRTRCWWPRWPPPPASDRVPLDLLVQQMVAQVQSFPLIAIPFFMLTGSLMMGGKLGEALVGVLSALIGRFHGGPAQVGVLSSTLFGGVSGSAVADASAIGSLMIPWHKRLGYPTAFSAATLACCGHDRHPDPAVDPDDPVRADVQRVDRRAVRAPACCPGC